MSTKSLILILSIFFVSNALAASAKIATSNIYQSITQVKTKLAASPNFEVRRKEFMKFYSDICKQRQISGAIAFSARQRGQLSEESLMSLEAISYNYYDLCDYLKEIPAARNEKYSSKSCIDFPSDIRRAFDKDGTENESTLTDLNFQAVQIGQLLYRCQN